MLARWLGNCLRWLGLAREVSRSGLGKRHRSQTRVNRCCALQDHSFRHIAACPWWSHWGFCSAHAESQGWTPGSCLALYFSSTPSLNEGSTIASPLLWWRRVLYSRSHIASCDHHQRPRTRCGTRSGICCTGPFDHNPHVHIACNCTLHLIGCCYPCWELM